MLWEEEVGHVRPFAQGPIGPRSVPSTTAWLSDTRQILMGFASKCRSLEVSPVSLTLPTPNARPATAPMARRTGRERHAESGIAEPTALIIRVTGLDPRVNVQSTEPSAVRT